MENLLFANIEKGAEFSSCKKHRYHLWRIWDRSKPLAMFIGLNPSTADGETDDATIKSVIRICNHNGYGGFYMMNCWSYIATHPKDLKINPFKEKANNILLRIIAKKCQDVVFAWGNFRIVAQYGKDVQLINMFPNAKALALNKNGSPKHPLYCKTDTPFINFKPC